MCLPFHVKGQCNTNCGFSYDHALGPDAYTEAEYMGNGTGLKLWCDANYPMCGA